jgi:hypothetical protein
MSEVIPLRPEKEPLVWVCQCGCSTFELLSTSEVRCPVCSVVSSAEGAWYAPDSDKEWDGEAPIRDISGNGSVEFARHQLIHHAKDDESCAIVVFNIGGSLHTWSMVENREQLEWFKEKLAIAYDLTAKRIADE